MGGDSRDYYAQNWYSAVMDLHGFAFLGSKGNNSHAASYERVFRKLGETTSILLGFFEIP